MKKILITGNSGYIGSHLSLLLSNKYEVHGLDRKKPQVEVAKHHLIDINQPICIPDQYDVVIHLAALVNVGDSQRIPTDYYTTNIFGTVSVLKNVISNSFIFASTGAAMQCSSAYGISKRAAEDCVRDLCTLYHRDHTIFRFYNVIGSDGFMPTNPDGLMYNLMKAPEHGKFTIYGNDYNTPDGTAIRDYVHVNEICNSIEQAIENPSNSVENLGHGIGHSVKQMVDLYKKINQVDFDVSYIGRRDGDLETSVLDHPSPYMVQSYNIERLLTVVN